MAAATDDDQPAETAEPTRPLLRVVRGAPTPDELAALVAVVAAAASGGQPEPPPRRSEWASPHHRVRGTHRFGPGAWRTSGR